MSLMAGGLLWGGVFRRGGVQLLRVQLLMFAEVA